MVPLIDTHAHLSMLSAKGLPVHELLEGLFSTGFGGIIDVGTKPDDLETRLAEFGRYPLVRFSAGIWPSAEAISEAERSVETLRRTIEACGADRIVAVGECGIDRHWNRAEDGADAEGERMLLRMQAELALELDLPIIIHSRDAAEETAAVLAEFPGLRGVIHCFSYGPAEARRFLDLGFHLSFSGTVTYKNAGEQREAARTVPADRLLAETDAPYLAPVPHRGKSADPAMVEFTYRALAEARGEDRDAAAERIAENARRLFGFHPKKS